MMSAGLNSLVERRAIARNPELEQHVLAKGGLSRAGDWVEFGGGGYT